MRPEDPNQLIRQLVYAWCERHALRPLATLLPSWLSNDGLTDGWTELHSAIRQTVAVCRDELPPNELQDLYDAEIIVDSMLRARG